MRLRSKDGTWRVDLISLSWTGDGRDGPRFRITRNGYFVAEVRTLAELARYVDPADLEETLIRLGHPSRRRAGPAYARCQYDRPKMRRFPYAEGRSHRMHRPCSAGPSEGIQRGVAVVTALMSSSHS